MEESDANLKLLVSNIINEKRYSHCRLCLKYIEKQFVRFNDLVTLDVVAVEFKCLSSLISELFHNDQFCEEIPGIDAVCPECTDRVLETVRFLNKCKSSDEILHEVINDLYSTLNSDEDKLSNGNSVYINVENNGTKIVLVRNAEVDQSKLKPKASINYDCFQCDLQLDTANDLEAHNLALHDELTCNVCYNSFPSNIELSYHIDSLHKFVCPHCEQRKDTLEEIDKHIDHAHSVHTCKECGMTCEGIEELRSHEQKHYKYKQNQCPNCGKVYSTKDFFKKHIKLCSEGRIDPHPIRTEIVKNFRCNLCGKGYSSAGGLRVHNRFIHGDAKPHVCGECGKEFTAPSYLKTHMIKHTGAKNFVCNICGNRFVSKEALLYHTRRHTGEKPYSCKLCSERFVNASARAEHYKFKHVGPTLMCEICSQKFVTSNFLKQHISRHHEPTSKLYMPRTRIPDTPKNEIAKKPRIDNT